MNMSMVISSLKQQLGLNNITLPFQDAITQEPVAPENIIYQVLTTTTIPIYSKYKPWIREGDAHIKSLEVVDKKKSIYKLPMFLTVTPVISVLSVSLPTHNYRGTYGDIAPAYGINRSVQGVVTSQAYMMLAGQMRAEPSFDYIGENKIRLYGYPQVPLTFRISCEHEPNGETIKDTCYKSFMELATLDMKIFLFNNFKYWEELPTAFGPLKLKTELFESAESERTALLKDWDEKFHLDLDDLITFM